MPRFICHLDNHFFEWSTISDGPVTEAMTEQEFIAYYKDEWGARGVQELPPRLERARQYGTSVRWQEESVEDLIDFNKEVGYEPGTMAELREMVGLTDASLPR